MRRLQIPKKTYSFGTVKMGPRFSVVHFVNQPKKRFSGVKIIGIKFTYNNIVLKLKVL
jgi:hypothetical protein